MIRVEIFEGLVEERVVVLEPMGFVHHEAGPADRAQKGFVFEQDLVGGEQGVEFEPLVARMAPLVLADLEKNLNLK